MHFDTTGLRRSTVTVLPPTPPEPSGGPRGAVVNIEIIECRREQRPTYGLGMVVFWLVLFALIALTGRAHSEPLHYDHWQSTDGWHGEIRTQGTTMRTRHAAW